MDSAVPPELPPDVLSKVEVLAGGGEMGALMRAFDWSTTPLGPVSGWPQSLRTALSILLASGYPMYIAWGPGFTQFYNDAYRPILGSTKHPAALGQSTPECFAEIWDFIGPMFHRVMTTGEATSLVDQLLPLDRYGYLEECYFTFSYSAIRDETGGVGGVFVTVIETTERVLSERRMQTLRDLGTAGARATSVPEACRFTVEVLQANPADIPFALLYLLDACGQEATLAGCSGLAIGTPLSPHHIDLTAESVSPSFWSFARALGGHHDVVDLRPVQAPLEQHDGSQTPHQAIILPLLYASQDHPVGFLIIGISSRRALDEAYGSFLELVAGHVSTALANATAHEAEKRRAEALAELDRAKTAFFSNVSHEFRTPLTLMLDPLEDMLVNSDGVISIEREELKLVHRNGLRMLRLVNTLLDFSRIEAGRVEAVYEPTDLATLTAELASVFRSAIERAGMQLIVDCPPLPEPVFVDRDMWEKITLNLLSNAFKFTFQGEIVVTLRPCGEHVELAVRDTGTGIPAEELPHLFERFHRIRDTRGRTHEGTGIGLALVQELVKLHAGTVRAESVYGQGSTFTVAILFGSAHLPAEHLGGTRTPALTALGASPYIEEALQWLAADADTSRSSKLPAAPPRSALSLAPKQRSRPHHAPLSRIVLADDNLDMREYIARLLGERYDVEAVSNGELALAAARERPPDLVLTDVMMPGLDGFELLKALRADPHTRTIPVILLSARAGEEARIEGLDAGADDYLIKPFSARELMARVGTHLELARVRREAAEREQRLRAVAEAGQKQLEMVLSSIRDSFVMLDRAWRYTYVNQRTVELARRPREALLGKVIWEEFPDTVGSNFYHELHRVVKEHTPVHFEYYYSPWKQWFDVRAYPAEEGVTFFTTDMTARKSAEEALQALNETLSQRVQERTSLLALLHDVTAAANEASHIEDALQFAVDRICAHTSWSVGHAYLLAPDASGDWIPAMIWHLDDPERLEPFKQATRPLGATQRVGLIGEVVATGKPEWNWEVVREPVLLRGREAQECGLKMGFAFPILIGKEVVGVLEFYSYAAAVPLDTPLLDVMTQIGTHLGRVVERQRATEQLQHQQEVLAQSEKLAAMGSLLASVAHELNNPLSVAMMEADLLREEVEAGPLVEHANKVTQAAERCAHIVQNFLALARQYPPEQTRVELNTIIKETLDFFANPLRVDNIDVTLELVENLPALWADPHQLRQVVVNLVSNAHQALREVAPQRRLTIITRADSVQRCVILEVADTGPGIPPAIQARIFEPFFTTKPAGVGTGLGLSLCRGIVESHGGRLRVQSQLEQGTVFSVELPVKTVPAVAETRLPTTLVPSSSRDKAILIVDDERGMRSALAYLLRRDGHTVETAANGRLALDKLQDQSFDLILCDLRMPDLDGIGLYGELETHYPHLLHRIVFLTGDTLSPETKTFFERANFPRLTKPFAAAEVRRMVESILGTAASESLP